MTDPSLRAMLEARSVAVVGASSRPGSVGEQMMLQLLRGGFDGEIHPVNPNYDEVLGRPCHGSVADLPHPVDLVLLGVSNERLEDQLRGAAAAGARSAVIFGSGHEEPRPGVRPLVERLAAVARRSGMAICGGNCMGFVNLERNLRALAFSEREDLQSGPVTWLSHSGSAFTALLHNDRGLRFNLAVSAGQELTTTLAQYLDYALDRPATRAVALFLETVRDPERFRGVLRRAEERDVPVVALKVGREGAARDLVTAHSGALAGEDAAYEALFEAHGVLRVGTLDEMADTLELLVAGRRAHPGGLAALHDSGGERAHLIDVAADVGVPVARISQRTAEALAEVLDPGLPAVNPVDAWGTGQEFERTFRDCMKLLLDDADTAGLAFVVDLAGEDLEPGYVQVAEDVFRASDKPFAVLCNLRSAIAPEASARLREAGIPVLEGTATGLAAFQHLLELRDVRALPPPEPGVAVPPEVRDRWRTRLRSSDPWSEAEGLRLVADYGVPAVETAVATTPHEAVSAAGRIGWPVALKTATPGVAHKADVDGVRLGVDGPEALEAAYRDLAGRLGPDVLVSAMAPPGVELGLGLVRDPQFGPVVVVAAGGLLVEMLGDRRPGLPPLDRARARRLVDGLAARPLLDGIRGGPAADLDAVTDAVVRLSVLAADLGEFLDALDVNPLIAGPGGCAAVDALVVPRTAVPPEH